MSSTTEHPHDSWREMLALRLYDELSAGESVTLERHLAECPDCARFAEELEQGLGAIERSGASGDLPADWEQRIDTVRRPAARPLAKPLLTFVAGWAAGVAVMTFGLGGGGGSAGPSGDDSAPETAAGGTRFEANAPPAWSIGTSGATDGAVLASVDPPPRATASAYAGFGSRLR